MFSTTVNNSVTDVESEFVDCAEQEDIYLMPFLIQGCIYFDVRIRGWDYVQYLRYKLMCYVQAAGTNCVLYDHQTKFL